MSLSNGLNVGVDLRVLKGMLKTQLAWSSRLSVRTQEMHVKFPS